MTPRLKPEEAAAIMGISPATAYDRTFDGAFAGGFLPFFLVAAKKKTELQKSRDARK